ncbi:MAG: hypothetical protein WD648_13185 [Planctomycetaceae bacterium]
MFDPHPDMTLEVIAGLGWIYLILFAMNAGWTYRAYVEGRHFRLPDSLGGQEVPSAGPWALYSIMLLLVALAHFTARDASAFLLRMPAAAKPAIDALVGDPRYFFALSIILFASTVVFRRWLIRPTVAWLLLNVAILFTALSMTDWDFRQIVGKPDNVPIVSMLFIVGFFTWLYFRRAVDNDERIAQGKPLFEEEENEKVLVWPDLVYTELICMVVLTVVLVVWGILLQAPLEEPSNSAKTPNPSKAPWYFLGLQEMLVYYDPWLAGVVFPSMIIVGLMAIPYIDFNKRGNGYYIFAERKFAVITFMFGFLPLWIAMIILGTFLRGPNWNIFGIYEFWDVHKLEALTNVNLSEYFWVLSPWGTGLPVAPANAPWWEQLRVILLREFPGFLAVFVYLVVLPPLLAATVFRSFFQRMGFLRYMVFSNLVLLMAALPIKMVLRWSFNLKYIIAIPEWFFNV